MSAYTIIVIHENCIITVTVTTIFRIDFDNEPNGLTLTSWKR